MRVNSEIKSTITFFKVKETTIGQVQQMILSWWIGVLSQVYQGFFVYCQHVCSTMWETGTEDSEKISWSEGGISLSCRSPPLSNSLSIHVGWWWRGQKNALFEMENAEPSNFGRRYRTRWSEPFELVAWDEVSPPSHLVRWKYLRLRTMLAKCITWAWRGTLPDKK